MAAATIPPPCDGFSTVLFNDTWVLSDANGVGGRPAWTQLSPATPQGLPAGRSENILTVYDSATNRMTVFGGCNDGVMSVPNDVWVLTNANGLGGQPEWIQLTPTGNPPAARCDQVMTYDPASHAMTVFGGCCPSMSDLWVLQHANSTGGDPAWQQLSQTAPSPGQRVSPAFGYDEQTNTLTLVAGYSYNPFTVYDDVRLLKDANDIGGGAASWVNTIPGNSVGAPSPGGGFGNYDSLSKRLMIVDGNDPSDLWVLSTRNGVDLSASAGVPPPAAIAQFQRAGIQYVVAEAPQSGGTLAGEQLDAFSAAGFKTAAYCFLYFDTYALPGDQQAQNCLNTIGRTRLASISFIAIDVEDTTPPLAPPTMRTTIVSDALQAIAGAGARPVIYTTQQAWRKIVGNTTQFQSYPLWRGAPGSFHTASGARYCGDGVASLTPFTAFGGWTVQLGKQYEIGTEGSSCAGASLNGVKVDFDVFDVSLFP